MPFDPEFKSVYDQLIVPALERVGFRVKRADSDLDQQNVLKDVVRGIANADLVLAELTSRNPNVLYELGISHALRRNTVLITQSMDDIPFDLRTYRVIRYSTQFDSANELSEQLEAIGKAHQEEDIDFGSPVIDFLPDQHAAHISVGTSGPIDDEQPLQSSGGADAGSAEPDDGAADGYLDAILALQNSDANITKRMEAIGESTQKIGDHFQAKTDEVDEINASGGPGMVVSAHRIASDLGKALDQYAAELSAEAPQLESDIEELIDGGLIFTAWLADQDNIDLDEAVSMRESLTRLGRVVNEGLESISGFRKTLVELSGISRDMARGTGRAISELVRISGALEQVEAFTEKAVDLLDERIPPDYTSPTEDGEAEAQDEQEGE
jgi:hypothetical protein